jgi:hypothetical protein
MVFENKVLRSILGPKKEEVTGEWRTTERAALWSVLLTKYYSGDQIKKNVMGGTCSMHGREEMCIQVLSGETGVKETAWKI